MAPDVSTRPELQTWKVPHVKIGRVTGRNRAPRWVGALVAGGPKRCKAGWPIFDRKRREARRCPIRQEGFRRNQWSVSMHKTHSSALLASLAGSLIVSVLLVGVST